MLSVPTWHHGFNHFLAAIIYILFSENVKMVPMILSRFHKLECNSNFVNRIYHLTIEISAYVLTIIAQKISGTIDNKDIWKTSDFFFFYHFTAKESNIATKMQ